MASFTNYLEDLILNATLRGTSWPAWTSGSHYVALFTAAPSDAGGGTEVSGGSYARVAITRGTGAWDAPADDAGSQKTANTGAITFPTATGSWGTVTHFAIFDASTSGNMLMWSALSSSKSVSSGDTASYAAGALTVKQG